MKVNVPVRENQSVLDYLREKHIDITAPCGGKGKCGKCKVKVIQQAEGEEDLTPHQIVLGEKAVAAGERLACHLPCDRERVIEVPEDTKDFTIVTDFNQEEAVHVQHTIEADRQYGVAIDIGTTTMAFMLVDLNSHQTKEVYTALNSGRVCGADVISRIDYVNTHGGAYLQELMQQDLKAGIETLCTQHGLPKETIKRVVIVGNTTMLHLLTGTSCETLGVYPFTPVFIDKRVEALSSLIGCTDYEAEAILLPGLSTYVGADIVSGILKCKVHTSEGVKILIDIGTNGEMIIGNKDKILGLATAAGPAFEGGNISCGTGSIKGAISEVYKQGDELVIKTIGDQAPIGICGSGLIDAIAVACGEEWIDETGMVTLEEDEIVLAPGENPIQLTQKDIRQFQLAKAAIRAGLEILVENYGITHEEVETIYLAGGFGQFINLEHAIDIGLLPEVYKGKIERVGNAALGGALTYLNHQDERSLSHIQAISEEINLSNQPQFNTYFIDAMLFEKE